MILAKVHGAIVSTQKTDDLKGYKLLLVAELDKNLSPKEDSLFVAIDKVGAGQGDTVLVGEYYPVEKDVYQGMSIVAIVEQIQMDLRK